ncbi:MAG: hypothetical protein JNL08_21330 [Planctomycetes bacterium]|nr:hypothetical protein [Planctomycetota bacterium]
MTIAAASVLPSPQRTSWPWLPALVLAIGAACLLGVLLAAVGYAFALAIGNAGNVDGERVSAFGAAAGERLGPALRLVAAFAVARWLGGRGRLDAAGAAALAVGLVALDAGIGALFGEAQTATDLALGAATLGATLVGQRFGARACAFAAADHSLLGALRRAATVQHVARALGDYAGGAVHVDVWQRTAAAPRWLAGTAAAPATAEPNGPALPCGDAHAVTVRGDDAAARRWRERFGAVADAVGLALDRLAAEAAAREQGMRDERERLASDIHDTIAQDLAGAALHLAAADGALPARGEAAVGHVRAAGGSVRNALGELRGLVWALRPTTRRLPLPEALQRAVDRFAAEHGVAVHAALPASVPPLSPEAELCLLRALQESLHNAVRHGRSTRIDAALVVAAAEVVLTVDDDGRGGAGPAVAAGDFAGGHGLSLLRDRLGRLGGSLTFAVGANGGGRVTVRVPRDGAASP